MYYYCSYITVLLLRDSVRKVIYIRSRDKFVNIFDKFDVSRLPNRNITFISELYN